MLARLKAYWLTHVGRGILVAVLVSIVQVIYFYAYGPYLSLLVLLVAGLLDLLGLGDLSEEYFGFLYFFASLFHLIFGVIVGAVVGKLGKIDQNSLKNVGSASVLITGLLQAFLLQRMVFK